MKLPAFSNTACFPHLWVWLLYQSAYLIYSFEPDCQALTVWSLLLCSGSIIDDSVNDLELRSFHRMGRMELHILSMVSIFWYPVQVQSEDFARPLFPVFPGKAVAATDEGKLLLLSLSRFDIRNTIHTYCRDFFITPQLHVSLPGRMQLAIYWKTATQTRVASLYPCRIHVNISKNNLGSFRRIIVTFVTKPGYWKKGELLPS